MNDLLLFLFWTVLPSGLCLLLGRITGYNAGYEQAGKDAKLEDELRAMLSVMRPTRREETD